jgi:hypothetical protein
MTHAIKAKVRVEPDAIPPLAIVRRRPFDGLLGVVLGPMDCVGRHWRSQNYLQEMTLTVVTQDGAAYSYRSPGELLKVWELA